MIINTNKLKQLDITINQFLLCAIIANNESPNGWCSLEKQVLANQLGLSEVYIFKMIRDLREKGLLEKHPINYRRRLLRVTQKWKNAKQRQLVSGS